MNKLLLKLFVKDYEKVNDSTVRSKYGTLAGIVGIISNIILGSVKVICGILVASSAIISDGVNNTLDAVNSIITLIGFKLSSKEADSDHPFGHQRIEYITGLIVSFIILIVGLSFAKESVVGIIDLIKGNPQELVIENKFAVIVLLVLSILVKFWQSSFYKFMGKSIDSQALIANSEDSKNDTITTFATLISTVLYILTNGNLNIDSIAGLVVAVFIILSSIGLIKDTVDPLLGVEPSEELKDYICKKVLSYEGVLGIHDLVIHSYGPNMNYVTIHVEVSREVDVMISHDMIDNIEADFRKNDHMDVTIHLDPVDNNNPEIIKLKDVIRKILDDIDPVLNFHDLRIVSGVTHTNVLFDILSPYGFKLKPKELKETVSKKIKEYKDNYFCVIQVDEQYNRITH